MESFNATYIQNFHLWLRPAAQEGHEQQVQASTGEQTVFNVNQT